MAAKKKSAGNASNGTSGGARKLRPGQPAVSVVGPEKGPEKFDPTEDPAIARKRKRLKKETQTLQEQAAEGNLHAKEALKRITDSFEKVKDTKAQLAVARSDGRKELHQSSEALRISMEREVDINAPDKDRLDKLALIERSWHDHEDTKGKVATDVRNARSDYKAAQKALETAVVEGRQTTLGSLAAGF